MYYLNLLNAKKRVHKLIHNKGFYTDEDFHDKDYIEHEKHRLKKSPKGCSCWMCGNPRKFFKQKTRQEILAEIKEKEQLIEIANQK